MTSSSWFLIENITLENVLVESSQAFAYLAYSARRFQGDSGLCLIAFPKDPKEDEMNVLWL